MVIIMKAVQIGSAGHAFYAYKAAAAYGIDIAAIACGSAGVAEEGTAAAQKQLQNSGFTAKLYEDWRVMLDTEKPDVAIINPQFWETAACAIYAMERGIHVFCEKPVACSLDELARVEEAYRRSGVKFAAMFGMRMDPWFLAAKKAVENGRIGKIRMMDSRKSYKLGVRPGFYKSRKTYCGILPWVGIHAIDWMQWLSGETYTNVHAYHSCLENGGNGEMDITSSAQFMMTNGVIATLTADMFRPSSAATHGDDRVRLVGTKGILEITDSQVSLLSDAEGGKTLLPLPQKGDIFADFLELILHGRENDNTAEDAFEVTKWALLAHADAEAADGK